MIHFLQKVHRFEFLPRFLQLCEALFSVRVQLLIIFKVLEEYKFNSSSLGFTSCWKLILNIFPNFQGFCFCKNVAFHNDFVLRTQNRKKIV